MARLDARPSRSGRLLDEPVLAEPLFGHLFGELALYVDLCVQVLQRLGGELLGDGCEQLFELQVLLVHLLAHLKRRVVEGEEALGILDELEAQTLDAPVGCEDLAEVATVPLVGLLVDLSLVDLDDVLARELEPVGFLYPGQAVVSGGELGPHAYGGFLRVLIDQLLEVREFFDAEILVDLFAHGDSVSVVSRRRRFPPPDIVLLEVLLGYGFELLLATGYGIRVTEEGNPGGPRVVPVHVDLARFQRLAGGDGPGQAGLVVYRSSGSFEGL